MADQSSLGNKIDGNAIAQSIRENVASRIKSFKAQFPRFQPQLVIVQAGERPDSSTYVRMKAKAAQEVGIKYRHVPLRAEATVDEIVQVVRTLNDDDTVSGILVQLPLGDHVTPEGERLVTEAVSPEKDVDGPPGKSIAGTNAVVLGRSDIVGSPVAYMLRNRDATVTQCHSRTQNIEQIIKEADILVSAIGKPEFVKGSWIKPGAVVIDVGINYVPDSTKKSGQRLVGDVEYSTAFKVASHITPVPGGVGPMTVAMLMENTLKSAERLWEQSRQRKVVPPQTRHSGKDELESYGKYKAKVDLSVLKRLEHRTDGKYIVISGLITPTPLGEGKSTTTIGLAQALGAELGRPAFACVRQPSQGPTFGIKGGAAGGGYSQVIPMDEFNLHLTGDIHAVTAANNLWLLLSTPKRLPVSLDSMSTQKRSPGTAVIDVNDRHLRKITIGQNPTEQGHTRVTGFDIAVASECMAVLALTTGLEDMKQRLGAMVVATSKQGEPITADDVGVSGALAVLLKDAIKPNLMQTLQVLSPTLPTETLLSSQTALHSSSQVLKKAMALSVWDTFSPKEAFGADMGMEKFCNIKCRVSGLKPDATVIVATTRALKMHGGGPDVTPGKPLHDTYTKENLEILKEGCKNLVQHIKNSRKFGVKVIVAINQFASDTPAELALVREEALAGGADAAVVSNHWAEGGAGARALADAVVATCEGPSGFKFLYDLDLPIAEKIEIISKQIWC
ncbi:tetrahydrofolate synthase [Paramarasmius palmivorus]|uniref:Tetrahydrofolate synthase n=1 Tax=Paramarasmius palmivorus TaxID=297713 RepID=A0AAW0DTJ9_9AGAR